MKNQDPDVESLYNWAMTMNLTASQYAILTKIVEKTVQHKLQAFADHFISMTDEQFHKERNEQRQEKANKTGLWENE